MSKSFRLKALSGKTSNIYLWGGGFLIILIGIVIMYRVNIYFFRLWKSGKETILDFQQKLFYLHGIKSEINSDQTIITTDKNITETIFTKLGFVTNSPIYNSNPMTLIGINVFLNGESEPVNVAGLFDIVKNKIDKSDKMAFRNGLDVHYPFLHGFGNGKSIGNIVDELIPFAGSVKHFQLILDPKGTGTGSVGQKFVPGTYRSFIGR